MDLDEILEKYDKKRYPFYEVFTGRDCNLRCTYCYVHNKSSQFNTKENIDTFLTWMYSRDATLNFNNNPVAPRLGFLGGEPLLHTELMDYALSRAHELNAQYHLKEEILSTIITNGTLIAKSSKVQDFLLKWKDHLLVDFSRQSVKEFLNYGKIQGRIH